MSMFLLKGSSYRSCNLASECTHVCWLVLVGVCAFLRVGWHVPPEVRVDCCALCVRDVRTLPRKTADVRKSAPLPPEPSRARPCHGFATLESKVGTLPRKTADVQKRAPLPPKRSRARPWHGFASLESKSEDLSTQNRGRPKARAAPEPSRARPCHGFATLESKSEDLSTQNRGRPKALRRHRQSPLEHAPATVSRPWRAKVRTFPRKTADVQKRCAATARAL